MRTSKELYRSQAISSNIPSPWTDWAVQTATIQKVLENVTAVSEEGYRPLVVLDLDLTTLLAPKIASAALTQCVASLDRLAAVLGELGSMNADEFKDFIRHQWAGPFSRSTLLPAYTDGGLEGYGLYLVAKLQQRFGLIADPYRLQLEQSITQIVYDHLRNGYWNRNILDDDFSPGLFTFLRALDAAGGEAVFFSNRPLSTRDTTIEKLQLLFPDYGKSSLDRTENLFVYFGPGGSQFDASAKSAAVVHVEAGANTAIYIGNVNDNTVEYPAPSCFCNRATCIVAIFDDRLTNRQQILAAAQSSTLILKNIGLEPLSVALATIGHAPEVSVVQSELRVADFRLNTYL